MNIEKLLGKSDKELGLTDSTEKELHEKSIFKKMGQQLFGIGSTDPNKQAKLKYDYSLTDKIGGKVYDKMEKGLNKAAEKYPKIFKKLMGEDEIKEDFEPNEDMISYKGINIEHFPLKWQMGDKEWNQDGYIIKSPYYLQSTPNKPKTYLPLYCEDESGEVINFDTLDDAKNYIDTYIIPKKGKIVIKHGDEVHYELKDKLNDEEQVENWTVSQSKLKGSLKESYNIGNVGHSVEEDGLPEVGRPFLAYLEGHQEYTICTRQNKEKWIHKSDAKDHISPDGEFYSGDNGWIYSIKFDRYIYVDDLELKSQNVSNREIEKKEQERQKILNGFIKYYGEELGTKLAQIFTKDNGKHIERSSPFYSDFYVSSVAFENDFSGIGEDKVKKFYDKLISNGLTDVEVRKVFDVAKQHYKYDWEKKVIPNIDAVLNNTNESLIESYSSENFNETTLDEIIAGEIDNMMSDDINKELSLFNKIKKALRQQKENEIVVLISDYTYDISELNNKELIKELNPTAVVYKIDDVIMVHENKNGRTFDYFASEEDANKFKSMIDNLYDFNESLTEAYSDKYYVTLYQQNEAGGPEEGGWSHYGWDVISSYPFNTKEEAEQSMHSDYFDKEDILWEGNDVIKFRDGYEVYQVAIESEEDRGELFDPALSWAERELYNDDDYNAIKPKFISGRVYESLIEKSIFDSPKEEKNNSNLNQNISYGEKAWGLNQIIQSMENEDAKLGEWGTIWDGIDTREKAMSKFDDEQKYKDLETKFVNLYIKYHEDGLRNASKEVMKMARQWDKDLNISPITNTSDGTSDDNNTKNGEYKNQSGYKQIANLLKDNGIVYNEIIPANNNSYGVTFGAVDKMKKALSLLRSKLDKVKTKFSYSETAYRPYLIVKFLQNESLEEAFNSYGDKAWKLNQIIQAMNNEEAYYGGWLYVWADGETYDLALTDFGDRESYKELEDTFIRTYKKYHRDGLFRAEKDVLEMAHKWDEKLGLPLIKDVARESKEADDFYEGSDEYAQLLTFFDKNNLPYDDIIVADGEDNTFEITFWSLESMKNALSRLKSNFNKAKISFNPTSYDPYIVIRFTK